MTNGEMIQSMFPNMNFGTLAQDDVIVNRDYSNNDEPQVFIPKSVWNAEYKEPTTKNNLGVDAVSRQALLNATVKKSSIWNHITNSEGDNLEAIVSKLPSVTPIRPKGHWCIMKDIYEDIVDAICSNCEHHGYHKWDYCPNCGAKMESEG